MKRIVPFFLAAAIVTAGSAGAFGASRVTLDRLTWSPDGRWLAVEARYQAQGATMTDTLLVDLNAGGLATRNPGADLVAFHEDSGRLAVATRYTLLYSPSLSPDSALVLARLDPVATRLERLAWSIPGDTIFVMSRSPAGWHDIVGYSLPLGRQKLLHRVTKLADADSIWAFHAGTGEPARVSPTPFSDLYLPIGGGVFHLERSEHATGRGGAWVYDLHRRDTATGDERIVSRNLTPWATTVPPDSGWVAIAGAVARPDYGGGYVPSLWIASADGAVFYTVRPAGAWSDGPVDVAWMGWHRRELWYRTPGGLFVLDPRDGRSRQVTFPATAEWSSRLEEPAGLQTLVLGEPHADSVTAVRWREQLRKAGHPAWAFGPMTGPFQVAVGGAPETNELEEQAVLLTREGIEDFRIESVAVAGTGFPFPFGRVRSPDGSTEAYLTEVGPPGFGAGELWISERHGARQVRLIRGMLSLDPDPVPLTGHRELPKVGGF